MPQPCNVVLSAAGRRVALMALFRQSLADLGVAGDILVTELDRMSAALHRADGHALVPPYRDPDCLSKTLDFARTQRWGLVVPTIDPDLPFYAEHRNAFAELGCTVHVSSPETVAIGSDKARTHAWLTEQGLPTVQQWSADEARRDLKSTLPGSVVVKPVRGSSSIGVSVQHDPAGLAHALERDDVIVQTLAPGVEYTVDVYVDRTGKCRCAVPRRRYETRAGEVSKAMTCRCEPAIETAWRVAEALPGAWGVLNVQLFHDAASGAVNVIEINPRFGGGYPLAHEAGAPMTRWLLEETLGLPCTADDAWRDGVVMLRYDEAVFVNRAQAGL